jgi:hypothetical protein
VYLTSGQLAWIQARWLPHSVAPGGSGGMQPMSVPGAGHTGCWQVVGSTHPPQQLPLISRTNPFGHGLGIILQVTCARSPQVTVAGAGSPGRAPELELELELEPEP